MQTIFKTKFITECIGKCDHNKARKEHVLQHFCQTELFQLRYRGKEMTIHWTVTYLWFFQHSFHIH